MTCGIYALYWDEQDKVYIGLSQNIEVRWSDHSSSALHDRHTNYLVQRMYDLYGDPQYVILEECAISKLAEFEVYWTKEFDALNPNLGLCLVEPGIVGYGTKSNSSKYNKSQILKVFSLLYRTTIPYFAIARRVKVPAATVFDIKNGKVHLWLRDVYPLQYEKMLSVLTTRQRVTRTLAYNNKPLLSVKSPEGIEYYNIPSIAGFCRDIPELNRNFRSAKNNFYRLLDGSRSQYKGWRAIVK